MSRSTAPTRSMPRLPPDATPPIRAWRISLRTTTAPTWSDGTAGGIDNDSITFDICRRLVDEWITVAEHDIASAVAHMIDDHHTVVEGAAGVALSAACEYAGKHPTHNVMVISCGANVSAATLRAMLTEVRPG